MDRRQFMITSSAAIFAALLADSLEAFSSELPPELRHWQPGIIPKHPKDGPAPTPEITAAVDVLVPADPDIPGDFKGSDYNGHWAVAAVLGNLGQLAVAYFLNKYGNQLYGKGFVKCTPAQQLEAIKQWIRDRDTLDPMFNQMLTGLLTISLIGTYENNDDATELQLFQRMGWYDPDDAAGTFRIPCEGYPDARQFPVRLKKGLRK